MTGIGYPDGQRVQNYDGPLQVDQQYNGAAASWVSAVFDCSRYARSAGFMWVGSGTAQVQLSWFADAAGTVTLGSRTFLLDQWVTNGGQFRIPNLGPFVSISVQSLTANPYSYHVQMFQTNRESELEFIPSQRSLIWLPSTTLGAGVTQNLHPTDYYAGPVKVAVQFSAGTASLFVYFLNAQGGYDQAYAQNQPALDSILDFLVPAGAWYVAIKNTGTGSALFVVSVQHSQSGST